MKDGDLHIEIYKTLAKYTDEEVIDQMKKTEALRLQLSLCKRFEIIVSFDGKYKSVYMVT